MSIVRAFEDDLKSGGLLHFTAQWTRVRTKLADNKVTQWNPGVAMCLKDYFDCWTHPTIYYWWDDNAVLGIKNAIQVSVPFNRCCLLRFTYMLYQISHIPDWVPGIFPSSSSGLGAKSVTSEVKIEVSTVVLVKKHTQKKIFFWKFQKMQFLAFMAKNYDFLWVWGVEKVATIYFKARRPKKIFFLYNDCVTAKNRGFWPWRFGRLPVARVRYFVNIFLL